MPDNVIIEKFYYVYVLESLKDGNRYFGFTSDLKRRVNEHSKGLNFLQVLEDHLN